LRLLPSPYPSPKGRGYLDDPFSLGGEGPNEGILKIFLFYATPIPKGRGYFDDPFSLGGEGPNEGILKIFLLCNANTRRERDGVRGT